jgi:hypothetical protein
MVPDLSKPIDHYERFEFESDSKTVEVEIDLQLSMMLILIVDFSIYGSNKQDFHSIPSTQLISSGKHVENIKINYHTEK